MIDGKILEHALTNESISIDELEGAMRSAGCTDIKDVHLATLELNGQISIVKKPDADGKPKVHRTTRPVHKGRKGQQRS